MSPGALLLVGWLWRREVIGMKERGEDSERRREERVIIGCCVDQGK